MTLSLPLWKDYNSFDCYEIVVDLVGNDGHEISSGNFQDFVQMRTAVNGSARIRRVVYYNGGRLIVDLRFHLFQIDFPAILRLQINKFSIRYRRVSLWKLPSNRRILSGCLSLRRGSGTMGIPVGVPKCFVPGWPVQKWTNQGRKSNRNTK